MEQILSFSINLFIVGILLLGITSIGHIFFKWILKKNTGIHENIALGILFNYFFLICLGSILKMKFAIIFGQFIFLSSIFLSRKYLINLGKRSLQSLKSNPVVSGLALIWMIPYIAKSLWIPKEWDEIDAYIPSVIWIVNNGTAFNGFLSNYTSMPQLVEYFLTHGMLFGNYSSIHFAVFSFGVLSFTLIYKIAKHLTNKSWAILSTSLCMAIPYTFSSFFILGKIDTVNTYFILLSIVTTLKYFENKESTNIALLFIIISVPLAIKYTSWILLIPIFGMIILNELKKSNKYLAFYLLIPILVCAPLLIKNITQTGNPLAPLFHLKGQKEFTRTHGEWLPWPTEGTEDVTPKITKNMFNVPWSLELKLIILLSIFILFHLLFKRIQIVPITFFALYVFLSILFWILLVGFNSFDSYRFLWPINISLTILIMFWISNVTFFRKPILSVVSILVFLFFGYQSRIKWYYFNISLAQIEGGNDLSNMQNVLHFFPEVLVVNEFQHLFNQKDRLLSTSVLWGNYYLGSNYWLKRVDDMTQDNLMRNHLIWSNKYLNDFDVGYLILDLPKYNALAATLNHTVLTEKENLVLIKLN